jgi:hypothetical protein
MEGVASKAAAVALAVRLVFGMGTLPGVEAAGAGCPICAYPPSSQLL